MIYIKSENHVICLANLMICSKYSFVVEKEEPKWWLELVYIGDKTLNISFLSEKSWLDAFHRIGEVLQCN